MRRFYTERNNLRPHSSVKMSDDEAQHIRDTLRMQKGERIILFNGEREFVAELGIVSKEVVMANVIEEMNTNDYSGPKVDLYQALIKPSNFELVLQKTTELGVNAIFPISTEYSQTKNDVVERKFDRWQKIILEACKQSERTTVPEFHELQKLSPDLMNRLSSDYDLVIAFSLQRQSETEGFSGLDTIINQTDTLTRVAIIIGPEGGFSAAEHTEFSRTGINLVEILGGRILKAETAAMASLSILFNLLT